MNRQDLFNEFSDVVFELAPFARQADDAISLQDVESLRQRILAICDLVRQKITADAEFSPAQADQRQPTSSVVPPDVDRPGEKQS